MIGSAPASEPVERVMLIRFAEAAELPLEKDEMLSGSDSPNGCIEFVIKS